MQSTVPDAIGLVDIVDITEQRASAPPKAIFRVHEAMQRIRADYLEMPDLRLTVEQGARFWQIEKAVCHEVLGALAKAGFVVCVGQTYSRTYARTAVGGRRHLSV